MTFSVVEISLPTRSSSTMTSTWHLPNMQWVKGNKTNTPDKPPVIHRQTNNRELNKFKLTTTTGKSDFPIHLIFGPREEMGKSMQTWEQHHGLVVSRHRVPYNSFFSGQGPLFHFTMFSVSVFHLL